MKSYRLTEVKSYNVPFVRLPRPVFWFNDPFEAGTWSDLHRHEHWGELAFMRSGYMVICTELGNYAAPPQRAVWIPPGLTHEWYIPEPSVDNALYIMPHVLPPGPRFQRYHAMEVSPLVRELIHALAPQPCDYEEPGPVARMVSVLLDQLPLLPEVGFPLPMPRDRRLVALCTALLNEPDSPETIREWCTRLGMSERTLARLFQRQTGEEGFSLEDVLCTDGMEEKLLERMALQEALARLNDKERLVIQLRYYHSLTQQRVAGLIGVSQVQVSRIEKKALERLRTFF